MDWRNRIFVLIKKPFLFFLFQLLSACGTTHLLVDTPNLYGYKSGYPSSRIPARFHTTTPEIFFVTDRHRETTSDGLPRYGTKRSGAMVFGKARVAFGQNLTWKELIRASSSILRDQDIPLSLVTTREIVRFPETPIPATLENGQFTPLPEVQKELNNAVLTLQNTLQQHLSETGSNDIILFVHGFNNDFQDAALSMADIWHFTGRMAAPVFFSWPAASGGVFGYFKDRESGEYSIYHLKELLRILADTPDAKRIHILAHSRGTDIITTALRELLIEVRACGNDPRQVLKIENLFLAAPDLDFGIVTQRLIAERLGPSMGQITIYLNQSDEALGLSQFIMSGSRIGKLKFSDLKENEKAVFEAAENVNFITVKGVTSFLGHGYYREHPGVLSDISIAIHQRQRPGDPGRPLIHDQVNFWTLPENYPLNQPGIENRRIEHSTGPTNEQRLP